MNGSCYRGSKLLCKLLLMLTVGLLLTTALLAQQISEPSPETTDSSLLASTTNITDPDTITKQQWILWSVYL